MSQGGLIPRWRPITKRTLDFFGRWGDSRTNLRGMLDTVLPVAVVDRFRDDAEGSIFGIQAFAAAGPANQFPSVSFGSGVNDWELLAVTQMELQLSLVGNRVVHAHMFTPIEPYNPAATPAPVGFFANGLLTNRDFTFGTVQAIGGYNPALPPLFGPGIQGPFVLNNAARSPIILDLAEAYNFPIPIRIYRDTTLTFQWIGTNTGTIDMDVSILYRERPKVTV